ncbi:MAG TPA: TIGR03546 family protein [Caldithrix abyssi]|uniref:TIGR03546 family protein n=1 Tax=Caldithrix abyssi TaxID=187145 RepID=A0A7V4U0Z4_CALAY|nr:TIGR03546 family protein [Caldithrix abyssi]
MLILKFLAKLIKILRSGATPGQIAAGFALGMIMGLTPLWTLHNFIVLLLLVVFNVNLSAAIFSFVLFSGFAYLLDPLFHNLGYFLLVNIPALKPFWTTLYNTPVIALSRFNNTVVMGSLVSALVLLPFAFWGMRSFVIIYREKWDPKLQKLKIVQMVKGSKLYGWYEKIKELGE